MRANIFDREGAVPALVPVLPYLPMPTDGSDDLRYDSRDSKRYGRGHSYSDRYGDASDLPAMGSFGSYDGLQVALYCFVYFVKLIVRLLYCR